MWQSFLLPLSLGIIIFLVGMKILVIALHKLSGDRLKKWVEQSTHTPLRGLLSGTVATALLQSSTAITIIAIGLVNSRMIDWRKTWGIILGTNIGTCLTTELISLNIGQYALTGWMISLVLWLASIAVQRHHQVSKHYRGIKMVSNLALASSGFAAVLLGMEVMKKITPFLSEVGFFTTFIVHADTSLWWGVAAGTIWTALIQSSSATIALTMNLTTAGLFSHYLAVAIVLGANIGTCATAFLASMGGSRGGYIVALFHLLLNVGGALLFFPLIPLLSQIAGALSHSTATQIAHVQTIYNVSCSLLVLPLCYLPFLMKKRTY